MFKINILVVVLIAFASTVVYAEKTGNDLLRGCNAILKVLDGSQVSDEEYTNALTWTGYIAGFTDSYSITLPWKKASIYCYPSQGLETGQSARIVAKYLKDNPNDLHESARLCLLLALKAAFPCSE